MGFLFYQRLPFKNNQGLDHYCVHGHSTLTPRNIYDQQKHYTTKTVDFCWIWRCCNSGMHGYACWLPHKRLCWRVKVHGHALMNPRRQAINCFLISTEEYLFFIFSPNMHGYACRFPSGTSVFIYKRIPPLPSNHLCAWKCIVDFNPASMLQIQFTPNTCLQL